MSDTVEIPAYQIAVKAPMAAKMMGCARSTFFQRVKDGIYPKPGPDGQWSVTALRAVHQANQPTIASTGGAERDTERGYTQPEHHLSPGAQAGAQ